MHEISMSQFLLLLQQLQNVEVGSTLCNGDCNQSIARNVHFRACYTMQRFVQLVLQWLNKIARQVARQIAKCNNALKT